jgi:hypothetical protein
MSDYKHLQCFITLPLHNKPDPMHPVAHSKQPYHYKWTKALYHMLSTRKRISNKQGVLIVFPIREPMGKMKYMVMIISPCGILVQARHLNDIFFKNEKQAKEEEKEKQSQMTQIDLWECVEKNALKVQMEELHCTRKRWTESEFGPETIMYKALLYVPDLQKGVET